MDLNQVNLIGNLTRDPEVKDLNGLKIAKFGLATNYSWRDKKSNDKKEDVIFHNVIAWRKLAEIVEKYLKKGQKVYIEGRINNRSYTDKSGNKRTASEIVANNLIMLSGKKNEKAEVVAEGDNAGEIPF